MTAVIFDKMNVSDSIRLIHNTVLDLTGDRITDKEKLKLAVDTLRNIRGVMERGITL